MVQLKSPVATITNGQLVPAMYRHSLKCIKSSKQFNEGETTSCYIAKYDNDRFAVWDTGWNNHNKYEVFPEDKLHEHFEETAL